MWTEPKTNWVSTDKFNYTDYNRIKGNIEYLRELALEMYVNFPYTDMGSDKTGYADYPYADEFNALEDNLESMRESTYLYDNADAKQWAENGRTPTYDDFNRLENACLNFYNGLTIQKESSRRLPFRLGSPVQLNEEAEEYSVQAVALSTEDTSTDDGSNYILTEVGL